ncbi:ATP-binding protein [Amycolatopsis saalfeldensis]|nr:DUF87 domain-containing protein [Amycolatopsis saalfeldensis]
MMDPEQRDALKELHFETTLTQEDVWTDPPVHVGSLNADAQAMILKGVRDARDGNGRSPIGVVLQGRKGAGKTHLLGWIRQQLRTSGGYFFLSNLGSSDDFWSTIVDALQQGLNQDGEEGQSQLGTFLNRLVTRAGLPPQLIAPLLGEERLEPRNLDELIIALRRFDRRVMMDCQDTFRALALFGCAHPALNTIGRDYLTSPAELATEERTRWGFRARPPTPQQVVSEVSKLLALTGPSVIAVDQIDTLVAMSDKETAGLEKSRRQGAVDVMIGEIANGLMQLREETRRTLTIVACLPTIWDTIRDKAPDTVKDRFFPSQPLSRIPDRRTGRQLVVSRLAHTFSRIGFVPPHETWPVGESAFADVQQYTPRQILNRIDQHVEFCLRSGEIHDLAAFAEAAVESPPDRGFLSGELSVPAAADLTPFDNRFEELRRSADVTDPLNATMEDRLMPGLLSAGLTAWTLERGSEKEWSVDPASTAQPAVLHARLRLTIDAEKEAEEHWSFRAIAGNSPIAAVSRLKKAIKESGIQLGSNRKLVLVRNIPWSRGAATQDHLKLLRESGGLSVPLTELDLRVFSALRVMLEEKKPGLYDWLAARRPAAGTELFSTVLPETPKPEHTAFDAAPAEPPETAAEPDDGVPMVPVGRLVADQAVVGIPLESLRKHVMIFAGSGTGKTVLIRRIVEECALLGVSSIVLDPNNDLTRLGDAWPQTPESWHQGDVEKARRYLDDTEVIVWTPGKRTGRPLAFPPLPDFGEVRDDVDEFDFAIREGVSLLARSARVDGTSAPMTRSRAVLNESLRYYGETGGRDLNAFISVLADLPDGVSKQDRAAAIASDLANTLRAAQVNDPSLDGTSDPVDPGSLLTPSAGKKARISVVNLDALSSLQERQVFVNRLQLELFAWIKRHPAGDRPLGGLLVMDEAQDLAPSAGKTPSTESSIRLASQARKYGLGLILATQAPKAVHNRVAGNATTQFFGRQNSPAHLEATKEMARSKGRDLHDLGRLSSGEFYVTAENFSMQKVLTPLCLSHHPRSPLTPEEVLDRARL